MKTKALDLTLDYKVADIGLASFGIKEMELSRGSRNSSDDFAGGVPSLSEASTLSAGEAGSGKACCAARFSVQK